MPPALTHAFARAEADEVTTASCAAVCAGAKAQQQSPAQRNVILVAIPSLQPESVALGTTSVDQVRDAPDSLTEPEVAAATTQREDSQQSKKTRQQTPRPRSADIG